MSEPEPAGKDLARQALANWKATAKKTAATGATKPRRKRRAQYGDGRDPVGLGTVLGQLGDENEWKTAVAAGSLTDQWASLCPELVGHVEPAGFDPATGRLDLRPAHNTAATQLRWLGPQLVTRLQTKGVPVRTIRVLRVGPVTNPAPAMSDSPPPQPEAPIKTRADASPGYRDALEAIKATDQDETAVQQRARAAAERQTAAMRAHREEWDGHTEAVWFANDLETKAREERDRLIRRIARDQKADRAPALPTVFQRTA